MRLTGLSSGLDTDNLISQLMAIERRPMVLIMGRQTRLQQQKTNVSVIGSALSDLKARVAELTQPATFQDYVATSSRSEVMTASASSPADAGAYEISVQALARAHKIGSDRQADAQEPLGLSGTFVVNGTSLTVNSEMTLEAIRDTINDGDCGARASIVDNTLVLTRAQTGADEIALEDDPELHVLRQLGLLTVEGATKHELAAASDAQVTIDGLSVQRSTNTFSDAIAGVTITLRTVSEETVTVNVLRNVQAVADRVTEFVNKYNSAIGILRRELGKDGNLRGDGTLQAIQRQLRLLVSGQGPEGGAWSRLDQIGVSSSLSGDLSVNRSELLEKLEADAGSVRALFADEDAGLAVRLNDYLDGAVASGGIISRRTSSLQSRIDDLTKSIRTFESRLELREQNLVRQFRELEVAMSSFQNQSAWLGMQVAQWLPRSNQG